MKSLLPPLSEKLLCQSILYIFGQSIQKFLSKLHVCNVCLCTSEKHETITSRNRKKSIRKLANTVLLFIETNSPTHSKFSNQVKKKKKKLKQDSSCTLQTVTFELSQANPMIKTDCSMEKFTRLLSSQSPLSHLHACQVGWSFPSPWRVGYGDAYSRDVVRVLRSSKGWSHNHHVCIWNRPCGMKYHQLQPEKN